MNNVIFIDEVRIRKSIKEAEKALTQAKNLVSSGVEVPVDVISRLEAILGNLEQKLIDLFEKGIE
mgnify:CR=1 FL=1